MMSINMRWAGLVLIALASSGCCWMAKRSCFPECAKPLPARVVTVEKPCELPPKLVLPAVTRMDCEVGGKPAACYDILNAGKLAKREADMKDWIRDARARCSPKPTSQPAVP